ncbi:MAG: HAMP domain-containing sensor histidine kinase [Elusimicrobiota bacterium]
MFKRRGVYFAFQGLLMAVLLLLFIFQGHSVEHWPLRFGTLCSLFTASLVLIQWIPDRVLQAWWLQMGLFVADASLASAALHWIEPPADLFALYLLVLFGTALTRSMLLSIVVAAVTSVLYGVSAWRPNMGLVQTTEFWLRMHFLWISTFLLALLARDAKQAQQEQEQSFQARTIQLESLATLGRVAGEVAHRIKSPLTTIRVNAEVLSHRLSGRADALKELAEIQEEVERCKTILKDLLNLGRIEEIDLERLDLRKPLRSALDAIAPQTRQRGITLKAPVLRRALPVQGDQSMLHEALLALLQNAVEASSAGGVIEVAVRTSGDRTRWWRLSDRGAHIVTVLDHGIGIARQDLGRLFRPFFTTKKMDGSGLGLAAALRIAQKHGGTVEAESGGPGHGATFTFRVPAA